MVFHVCTGCWTNQKPHESTCGQIWKLSGRVSQIMVVLPDWMLRTFPLHMCNVLSDWVSRGVPHQKLIKLLKTVWQGESDHGSTTRLDSQDISIAQVQCTQWLSVQGGSTPKILKPLILTVQHFEKCLAEWIRSLQYYHTTFNTFITANLTLWILQSPTHLLLLVGLSLSEWCYNHSQKHLHIHGTTCLMLGGLLNNPCYKQSQAPP